MQKIKKKFLSSTTSKVILGMLLAVLLTTSVFAATGTFNKSTEQVITQEQLQDHIKDKVIEQLEAKINELLNSGDSDISQKVANSLNQEEILNRLRQQIEEQISQYAGDLNIEQLDKLIEDTINSVLDSIINETVKVAIDEAIANANIDGSFSVSEALRVSVETEVKNQINKLLDDNVDSIVEETINKVIKIEGVKPETPPTPEKPTDPEQSETPDEKQYESLEINVDDGYVSVDPSSQWTGKSIQEFLEANKDELSLVYEDSSYGMYIKNIGNLITSPYYAVKEGTKLVRYDHFISFSVNGNLSDYGVRDTNIGEDDTFMFLVDGYKQGDTLAEIIPYAPGKIPYQINLWGKTQSNEHASWIVKTYSSLDGSDQSKVEDVIKSLGLKIETSGTGYKAFSYSGVRISQSAISGGTRAFVPTVYKMTSDTTMTYAKGVDPAKSSIEYAAKDTEQTYFFANEWDGKTSAGSVTFE